MLTAFNHDHYVGLERLPPTKNVVHIFDLDDTLSIKPSEFNNAVLTKDEFFDAAQYFSADCAVTDVLRLIHSHGDAIAVCTARPPERLAQSYAWLRQWRIPFDVLMLSTGLSPSNIAKQHMIKHLRRRYNRIGTMFDDSIYNVQGARLQKIGAIHIRKNDSYWEAHPETVVKV